MSEEAYQILFTLPDYNALKRHTVGGGRGQIEIDESTIAVWEQMVTHAVRHKGCVFAAAIVVVAENEAAPEQPKVISWKEGKRKRA